MEKNKWDELHQRSLDEVHDYLKTKNKLSSEDKEKVAKAKTEWQEAWSKLQEVLLYLEQIEI